MGDGVGVTVFGQVVARSSDQFYSLIICIDLKAFVAADSSREVITSDVDGFVVLHSINSILKGGVSVLSNRGNSGRVLGNSEFAESIGVGEGSDLLRGSSCILRANLLVSHGCNVLVALVLDVDLIIRIYGKGRGKLKADFHGLDVSQLCIRAI